MSAIITAAQLEALDACEEQLAEFRRIFPTGTAEVTVSRAKKLAQVFDWDWAAKNLLTDDNARAGYKAACASARAGYKAVCASARAGYKAACASARAGYEAVCAEAFARSYIMQEAEK